MDFHRLSRRDLQSLCKLNKIPANITNLAMADALHSLRFVEGIEELLLKAKTESVTTSIDSPERKVAAGGEASVQVTTTAKKSSTRKTKTTSSRMAISEEMMEAQKTPAVVRSTRRKKKEEEEEVGVTSAVQRVYSTRRSTRLLSEKKAAVDKDKAKEMMKNEAITIDLGEIVEVDLREVCDNNNITFSGNGSQTVVQESGNQSGFMGSEIAGDVNNDDEVNKPNAKTEKTLEALDELNVGQEDNSHSLVIENDEHCEDIKEVVKSESTKDVKDSDVQEESGDDHEEKADMITEGKADMITEDKAATDMKSDAIESEVTKEEINTDEGNMESDVLATEVSSFDLDEGEKESTISEVLNCCDPKENAVQPDINSMGSSNALDSEKEIGSEVAAPVEEKAADIKPEATESEVEVSAMKTEKPLEHLKSETVDDDAEANSDVKKFDDPKENAVEPETDSFDSSGKLSPVETLEAAAIDLSVQKDFVTALCGNDANETKPAGGEHFSKSPEPMKSNVFASILADDPLTNHVAAPIRLTPLKKSSTKTPLMKRLNNVGDDKENIDHSGVKFELTKEKVKTNKKENGLTGQHKGDLNEKSLRELTKMLKEKLQISNNNTTSEEAKDEMLTTAKVAKAARPALQKLSENCLIASNNEN